MPRFVTEERGILVSTSFKVMYSSFVESSLGSINEDDFSLKLKSGAYSHFMAVRDPYARLASFFADKLRESVERNVGEWQPSQKIFFPFIGVAVGDPLRKVRDALLGISFDEFVDYLPHLREEHLVTQSNLFEAGGIDLKPLTRIFRIETEVARLWRLLGIEEPPHANKTSMRPDVLSLSRERLDVVNEIYSIDFLNFGYQKK